MGEEALKKHQKENLINESKTKSTKRFNLKDLRFVGD